MDEENTENERKNFNKQINNLLKSSDLLLQSAEYLKESGENVKKIALTMSNPISMMLPNYTEHIENLSKKSDAAIWLAISNLNVATSILEDMDDTEDSNGEK